jgi:uncharacterized OsmC-like protein
MAQTSVRVRTVQDACVAVGWAGHRTLTVDRPEQAGGMGLGFNGGELLLLAIGGCYCNDIFREAAKLGMVIKACRWMCKRTGEVTLFVHKMSPTRLGLKQRPVKPIFWP